MACTCLQLEEPFRLQAPDGHNFTFPLVEARDGRSVGHLVLGTIARELVLDHLNVLTDATGITDTQTPESTVTSISVHSLGRLMVLMPCLRTSSNVLNPLMAGPPTCRYRS